MHENAAEISHSIDLFNVVHYFSEYSLSMCHSVLYGWNTVGLSIEDTSLACTYLAMYPNQTI